MRELDRVKDKIEIRLDPRQVVTLGVATTLFCGALFGAGFFVGRKQARPAAAEPADLAALDAASRAVRDDARGGGSPAPALGDVEFIFPAVVAAGPGRGPEQTPVRVPAVVVQPDPGTQIEPRAVDTSPRNLPPAVPSAAVPSPPMPRVVAEPPARVVAEPPARVRPVDEPPPPPDELDVARPAAQKSTVTAVPPPPDEDEPRAGAAPGPGSSTAGQKATYTLQVKAAREKPEADAVVEKLRKAGFEPSLIVADVPGKGRVYRVRVGRFENIEKAREFQRRLKAESGLPDAGFVTDL
jgi:cell division protein FtsN